MPNYPCNPNVFCPFYQRDGQYSVTCEGIVPDTLMAIRFRDEDSKDKYMMVHCYQKSYAKTCPFASALMEIYKDDE
jgi:hypothetical protein